LKKEQAAHAELRKEVDEARAATAKLQQALEKAQAVLQAERAAGGDRGKDLAAAKDALEQELKREQAAHAKLRKEVETARGAAEAAHAGAGAPAAGKAGPANAPVRGAKRHAMSGEVDIQIDGNPSKLIDLSTTGAQILSPGALKPNRLVTLLLPVGDGRLACK